MIIDRSNKTFYSDFVFLLKAKGSINGLKCISIEDNRIIASCGARLHIIESDTIKDMDNGIYEVEKVKQGYNIFESSYDFPKFTFDVSKLDKSFEVKQKREEIYISRIIYYLAKADIHVNYKYIKDTFTKDLVKINYQIGTQSPILITNLNRSAFIMPMEV